LECGASRRFQSLFVGPPSPGILKRCEAAHSIFPGVEKDGLLNQSESAFSSAFRMTVTSASTPVQYSLLPADGRRGTGTICEHPAWRIDCLVAESRGTKQKKTS